MEFILLGLLIIWIFATLILAVLWLCWAQQQNLYVFLASSKQEASEIRSQIDKLLVDAQEERKDLYDRLMAGTLPQYKEHKESTDFEKEQPDETLALEDAKDELMGQNAE